MNLQARLGGAKRQVVKREPMDGWSREMVAVERNLLAQDPLLARFYRLELKLGLVLLLVGVATIPYLTYGTGTHLIAFTFGAIMGGLVLLCIGWLSRDSYMYTLAKIEVCDDILLDRQMPT